MKMFTATEAATALGVTRMTLNRYTKLPKDALKATRIRQGRRFILRISEDDLKEFAKKNGLEVILDQ